MDLCLNLTLGLDLDLTWQPGLIRVCVPWASLLYHN
jgi:hypothetical protein